MIGSGSRSTISRVASDTTLAPYPAVPAAVLSPNATEPSTAYRCDTRSRTRSMPAPTRSTASAPTTAPVTSSICNCAPCLTVTRSAPLFMVAAVAEIGGCWLVWQSVRESRRWWLAVGGPFALAAYGFVATAQPDSHFGRVLAAYGGVFVVGSLLWGVAFEASARVDTTSSVLGYA
jgi:small multidrug resistance family-3 protein